MILLPFVAQDAGPLLDLRRHDHEEAPPATSSSASRSRASSSGTRPPRAATTPRPSTRPTPSAPRRPTPPSRSPTSAPRRSSPGCPRSAATRPTSGTAPRSPPVASTAPTAPAPGSSASGGPAPPRREQGGGRGDQGLPAVEEVVAVVERGLQPAFGPRTSVRRGSLNKMCGKARKVHVPVVKVENDDLEPRLEVGGATQRSPKARLRERGRGRESGCVGSLGAASPNDPTTR